VANECCARCNTRRSAVIGPSRFAGIALACATIALCACTTAPPRQAETAAPAVDQPFTIDGRLSARRGSDGATANFAWNHENGRDRIDFASPFGQVYARIDANNDRIVVERPGGATDAYPDWRSMTVALLGAPVPMDDLAFWIRGAARARVAASVERDAQGRVVVLRQQAWEIVYTYADDAPLGRPSRLVLKYPGAEPVEVRIVVDRWGDAQARP
jgi:outer membrane lipoprotein LolB